MRHLISAVVLAAMAPLAITVTAVPAAAQSAQDQSRWDAAQARYRQETDRYYAERDRYYEARSDWDRRRAYAPPPAGAYDDRYDPNYDAARHYRDGQGYQERVLASDDRVYRGSDGRYYCKRNDGTTGLIVGAAGGGILGNVIDGGHSRTAGTLIGAAIGALAGKAVEQNNNQIRCR